MNYYIVSRVKSQYKSFIVNYLYEHGSNTDLYYWYYGSLCVFQQGGETWKKWNDGLKRSLIENQCKEGDDLGSWNPVGNYSGHWGRVGQTALSCLSLEVYWRYVSLFK